MKIICSWCRRAGKADLVGEKIPLDDLRETHGICKDHRTQLQELWKKDSRTSATTGRARSMTGDTALVGRQDPRNP